MPVSMDEERFDKLVENAIDQIPDELFELMNNCFITVEDLPEDGDTEIFGLYDGIALTERDTFYSGVLPDRIVIYRNNILDACENEEEVVDEVCITVVHEVAHFFGIDDDRLDELGWA